MNCKEPQQYESEILHSCLDYLRIQGIFCWRQNSGSFITPDKKRYFKTQDINGVADIIGLLPSGRFLAVECKRPGGKQSAEQKAFQTAIERNNGMYVIAKSIEDLKNIKDLW
jgi:hypothetical protein